MPTGRTMRWTESRASLAVFGRSVRVSRFWVFMLVIGQLCRYANSNESRSSVGAYQKSASGMSLVPSFHVSHSTPFLSSIVAVASKVVPTWYLNLSPTFIGLHSLSWIGHNKRVELTSTALSGCCSVFSISFTFGLIAVAAAHPQRSADKRAGIRNPRVHASALRVGNA